MSLPEFGFITKADKQKLDNISAETLLTKTDAADIYADKTNYIADVVESDTGYVFINGTGAAVATIAR